MQTGRLSIRLSIRPSFSSPLLADAIDRSIDRSIDRAKVRERERELATMISVRCGQFEVYVRTREAVYSTEYSWILLYLRVSKDSAGRKRSEFISQVSFVTGQS